MTQTFKIANFDVNSSNSTINSISVADTNYVDNKVAELARTVEKLTKTPEVRPDTTTKLDIKNGKISVKHYKDGFFKSERTIMPDIRDVTVHLDTVLVTFSDDTKTVAVLDNDDAFSLEQGISICITKKLLGQDGSSIYNKLVKRALKVKQDNEKAAKNAEKAKEEARRRQEIARIRHEKKQLKKRENTIEMYKEAIIRAIERLNVGIDSTK